MSDRIHTVMLPNWSAGNPYMDSLAASVRARGVEVAFQDYPKSRFPLNAAIKATPSLTHLHLHWPDPYFAAIFWSKSSLQRQMHFARLWADLTLARLRGKRIVWTIHNLFSHESGDRVIERDACRLLARMSHQVIAHSRSALLMAQDAYGIPLEFKANIVPMGDFIGFYGEPPAPRATDGVVRLLAFGAARPYKGLERLIEIFLRTNNPTLRLTIAGRPVNAAYGEKLRALAASDARISFLLQFIVEAHVQALYADCDYAIAPFERTLTSASVVTAMSLRRASILPNAARCFDIVDDTNTLFFEGDAGLQKLLETLDATEAPARANAAFATAQAHSWPAAGALTHTAYLRAAGKLG